MEWIKTSDLLPVKNGLYFCKAVVSEIEHKVVLEWFGGFWIIEAVYLEEAEISWLFEY